MSTIARSPYTRDTSRVAMKVCIADEARPIWFCASIALAESRREIRSMTCIYAAIGSSMTSARRHSTAKR